MGAVRRGKFLPNLPHHLALLGLVVVALSVASFILQDPGALRSPAVTSAPARPDTDRQIESLQLRLQARPEAPHSYVQLGSAYLQKARETGDLSYYARAEAAARKALELEPGYAGAMVLMGAVALGSHQFPEALAWAGSALELDQRNPDAYGVLGDAQIELGQFEAGIASYQSMADLKPNLNSYARVSHARALAGDVPGAIEVMEMAAAAGAARTESAAWARVQLGDLYFNSGRVGEAADHYEAALRHFAGYPPALASLSKARAAQGRHAEAIDLLEQAVAIVPQPASLAALGDLYALTGQPERAQLQYDTVELIARLAEANQQVYNRDLALFYADHGLKPDLALDLAQREFQVRQDIYGYDALAWALLQNGQPAEAAQAIEGALKLGTQDASIFYHAGMIYYGLNDYQQARFYLEQALALNPHFSILHADKARDALHEVNRKLAGARHSGAAAQ